MGTAPDGYFDELAERSFGPGWAKPEPSLYPEPKRDFPPFHWRYTDARAALHAAGEFVSVEFAERRNLICVNPKKGNTYASTPNLVAAYQMVLPHESPRAHHHTPSALRVAVDVPPGTYTVVDGTRIDMAGGDVLLTPNWRWHGHGNDSDEEAYWIDILDVPLIHQLRAMFFETHPDLRQTIEHADPASPMRFAAAELARSAPEIAPGVRRAAFGADHLLTIELEALSLAGGASLPARRTTTSSLLIPLSGAVVVDVEDVEDGASTFTASRGDVVAIPPWWRHRVTAGEDAVVLRASDEPLLRHLRLYREEISG